jgi:hypothetical protein
MGIQITAIHRIVTFTQSTFFEPYITFNSTQRQAATDAFSKDFFKLKNNSLFGKTMESVRSRKDMRICQTKKKVIKYISKPLFLSIKDFGPNLVGIQLLKEEVLLDKPLFIGQAVLDLSKLVMFKLRYQHLSTYALKFGGSISVAGGDTDSLFLEVRNISLKEQLLPAMMNDGLLDTSNYPRDHPFHSNTYKARLGCVKDEGEGEIFKEWVLLRPKCYSMITMKEHEHKRAKGIQRCVVANEMKHSNFLAVHKEGKDDFRDVRRFSSTAHSISTIQQRKKALTGWEDKRAWISPNHSVAYGHYSLSSPPASKRLHFSFANLL